MTQGASTVESSPPPEEVEFMVDGTPWTARVLGRSGGAGPSRVSMLMLGFWPTVSDVETEGAPEHQLEALVVGQALDALSPWDLERAFGSGRPPKPRDEGPPPSENRGRGRRGGAGRRRRS